MSDENSPESYLGILQSLNIMTSRGTVTESSRGFWGGVTDDGTIVITAWDDSRPRGETYFDGRIRIGTAVRLIILEPLDRSIAYGKKGRKVKSAKLMPGFWRISEHAPADGGDQPIMRVRSA
jgi:hypothetical protein